MKTTIRNLSISALLLLTVLCFLTQVRAETKTEILGITIGMSKDQAHQMLAKIGNLDKNESKNQEVWVLTEDPLFSHLIVAFNREYTQVRFVTAKARENGRRVRYSDVLDIEKATQTGVKTNNHYVLEVPAEAGRPGYRIKARGTDAEFLTYLSIEQIY